MNVNRWQNPVNIVVADDGSPHALAAARLVGDLPLPTGSQVTVLAVLSEREGSVVAERQAALENTERLLRERGIPVKSELKLGYPGAVIEAYAREHQADLLVMGAKGRRATLDILLGGVTQQMLEYTHCPLLTVRMPYDGLRRILLVTDGSARSQKALEFLAGFPLPPEVEWTVLHVLPPPPVTPEAILPSLYIGEDGEAPYDEKRLAEHEKLLADEKAHGQELLAGALEQLKQAGIQAESRLRLGDAATEIIDMIQEEKIDLVVAGSRGLSPMNAWLLGSVSRKLVHYATCSVLIVK